MSEGGPTYTRRHGVIWLAAALLAYLAISQEWLGEPSPKNVILGYLFAAVAALIGIYELIRVRPTDPDR